MSTRVTTPEAIASFPNLFEASGFPGTEPKYSITLLWEKEEDLSALKAACEAAAEKKWGDKRPANIQFPMKNGDEKLDKEGNVRSEYAGRKYLVAKSKQSDPPKVVDLSLQPFLDATEIYGGCKVRAAISFFAWSFGGQHGISAYLGNIQKTQDSEPFGGGGNSVENDFGAF